MSDRKRVNGTAISWGSMVAKIEGDRFYGFTSIDYADGIERAKGYGMGKHHAPTRRSKGKYSVEPVKVTGWKSSVQALRAQLAYRSQSGRNYGEVPFTFVVQYIEPDDGVITVELEECKWAKNQSTDEENPDPLKETFELDCMRIRRNGLVLWDDSEGTV